MREACDPCLRRGHLIGRLAPHIAGLLDRPARRRAGLLALDDEELAAAVLGDAAARVLDALESFDPARAREELDRAGTSAVCRHARRYPAQLARLDDDPAVLYITGEADPVEALTTQPAVALVGARRASPHGLEVARALGRELGACGVTVVSGLALGIDAAAHRGCIDGGGTPAAVLACGPDVPYPKTNQALYARVRESGLVMSELPLGVPPYRWGFPARNRIMAGLSAMTVVVEAADPSGSLITSDFATHLHGKVGAVPGQVTSGRAAGSNRLLKDGATVVTSAQDILDELFGTGAVRPPPDRPAPVGDPVHALVLEGVEAGLGIDGICAHAGLPVQEARAALSRLESSGHVGRDALGGYLRRAVPH